jgi:hypothetical protein
MWRKIGNRGLAKRAAAKVTSFIQLNYSYLVFAMVILGVAEKRKVKVMENEKSAFAIIYPNIL